MRFNRLRLLGFKSFVDPGEFVIERGLTGVVGPNGCGKSNLVEALRWVMGESSYKNMRASGMDDVIFSGSGTRPARNTAEVTLFLDNSDRTAPAAFNTADELQVSRRIERASGSVYRINGKEARAKDVQLLFADQSTGARSPSMVGQGRIGELIQAKPQARRALLEEAAGISGLHSRRHEAELRLRAAEQNLERLDDVTGELTTQIDSLKRQARQALRFKTLSADIRKAEATLLHLRWVHAKAQEGEAKSALARATSLVAEQAQAQIEAAKEQAVGAHKLPRLREAEAAAAAVLQRLTIARTQLEEETKRIAARRDELAKRLAQADADIARERQLMRENAGILERLAAEEAELKTAGEGQGEREADAAARLVELSDRLAGLERELSSVTAKRAENAAIRAQVQKTLRDLGESQMRTERQSQANAAELAALDAKAANLPDPAERRAEFERAETERAEAEDGVTAAEAAVPPARAAEAAARPPVQEARNALARVETEARTLAKILSAGGDAKYLPVLDKISVARGYETALGAALGDDLDLPLDVGAAARWTAIEGDGDPELPAGVEALAGYVTAPLELARRLRQIGVVSREDGARLHGGLAAGQMLVSREGDLWRWDGIVAGADAPTAAAQRLAQRNRLAELEREQEAAREAVASSEAALKQAEEMARHATDAERSARERLRLAQKTVGERREALAQAERARGEIDNRRGGLDETAKRLAEALAEIARVRTEAETALAEAPDPTALDAEFSDLSAKVSATRQAEAEARAARDGLVREAEQRARRLAAIETERQGWVARAQNAGAQVDALTARRGEAAAEAALLADAPGELEMRRRALAGEIDKAEAVRRLAADALASAETGQVMLDRAATDAIEGLSRAREERGRAEERLSAAEERRREVEARMREVVGVEPHLVARQAELLADQAEPEIADVERRLDRLKGERERLGAVNLRAEEEARELSDRYDLITRERVDVVEAIARLREAIQSLNREGRERLLAAFGRVDAEFRRLFTHLFGGGTAELQLIESDDPLEAGLEILARPPGKRPQTMTLLSGGEQALTAMALIFAVFLTNPAPICVLDEVDAPLDDQNVERFCNLMDEMAATTETRFVIITHNPITMARMNRLFGVTMAEQGVSQLVSVDLETAEQLREAV
ncbi:chromosome segregation protein SMC [Mesorhizobium sp. YIM 152430]|uniref:chromosome segregation protein SMC n=1 Tax=Mesorhizobium sp. YIM 152430 TaxID=3031761 RepID=UPI0023D9E554|nr:chromosome segregation protein SMC [Mesorhizobium sp. YIM 152430]MDF1601240.1 chromosome segregation protein SMC [Mesorhizobium sp. YIM 152430]